MTKQTTSSDKEGEYPDLNEVLASYLTGERPIDEVVKNPDCQMRGLRMCSDIVRNADKGRDLWQSLCKQMLRHDCEGPPVCPRARRAQSLRAAGLTTLDEFWLYLGKSARNLARSKWRKGNRRQKKAPTHTITADELARMKAEGVSPEDKLLLLEALKAVNDLPEKISLAFNLHWLQCYSARRAGKLLGCSHVAVRARVCTALRHLRSQGLDANLLMQLYGQGTVREAA